MAVTEVSSQSLGTQAALVRRLEAELEKARRNLREANKDYDEEETRKTHPPPQRHAQHT